MAKWTSSGGEQPDVQVGDRVAILVAERDHPAAPKRPAVVLLTATENGWVPDDPRYDGYTPNDGVFWITERDLCQFARDLVPDLFT